MDQKQLVPKPTTAVSTTPGEKESLQPRKRALSEDAHLPSPKRLYGGSHPTQDSPRKETMPNRHQDTLQWHPVFAEVHEGSDSNDEISLHFLDPNASWHPRRESETGLQATSLPLPTQDKPTKITWDKLLFAHDEKPGFIDEITDGHAFEARFAIDEQADKPPGNDTLEVRPCSRPQEYQINQFLRDIPKSCVYLDKENLEAGWQMDSGVEEQNPNETTYDFQGVSLLSNPEGRMGSVTKRYLSFYNNDIRNHPSVAHYFPDYSKQAETSTLRETITWHRPLTVYGQYANLVVDAAAGIIKQFKVQGRGGPRFDLSQAELARAKEPSPGDVSLTPKDKPVQMGR